MTREFTLEAYDVMYATIKVALTTKVMKSPTVTMLMNGIDDPTILDTFTLVWYVVHLDISARKMPHRRNFVRTALSAFISELETRTIQ